MSPRIERSMDHPDVSSPYKNLWSEMCYFFAVLLRTGSCFRAEVRDFLDVIFSFSDLRDDQRILSTIQNFQEKLKKL